MQRDRPNSRQGGDARRGQKQAHVPGKQLPASYVIYVYFEGICRKIKGPAVDPKKNNTQKTQHHEGCSYCYIVVRCDGHTYPPVQYRGPDAAEHDLRIMVKEQARIHTSLALSVRLRMIGQGLSHLRETSWERVSSRSLSHHRVYRGAPHNTCNLKLRLCPKTTTIPVAFHNLRRYDSHLPMQAISKVDGRISCSSNNTEK